MGNKTSINKLTEGDSPRDATGKHDKVATNKP
jgi:hypothetical protein